MAWWLPCEFIGSLSCAFPNQSMRFLLLFLLCSWALPGMTQVVHSKQIYLWDVTLSMKQNGIWEEVKGQLIESLSEVKDLDTEVIVVPFQDDVFEERRVTVGDAAGMADLVDWIEAYDVPMPKGGHGTNICRALERAEDFVIKENIDCVFLMTDGTHEPKRMDMARHYPEGCLTEYLEDRWCTYATELDAYLVYYHLLGNADPDIQRVTDETCRVLSLQPGDGTPDRLYYISPQVQVIARDEAFIEAPSFSIPVTTSLPSGLHDECRFSGALEGSGYSAPLDITFTGTSLECSLGADAAKRLDRTFPESVEEVTYDLQVRLEMEEVEEAMVALTADRIPFQFHHFEERWFDIKLVEE